MRAIDRPEGEAENPRVTSSFANIVMRRDLLRELTLSELRSSASESRLGWVWWLIDPLVTMLIYWFVVVGILGRGQQWAPYPVFILCALLPFKHFSGALSSACKLLRSREGLIKSVPFPTMILPLSQVLSGFGYFLFGLMVLLSAAWIWGRPITPALAQLPALMSLQILLAAGVALAVSAWGALVRDLSGFMGHAQRILFYLSPTLYGIDLVQERFGKGALSGSGVVAYLPDLFMLNPLAVLFTGYRHAIFYGTWLEGRHWAWLTFTSVAIFAFGYRTFQRYDRRVIKFL